MPPGPAGHEPVRNANFGGGQPKTAASPGQPRAGGESCSPSPGTSHTPQEDGRRQPPILPVPVWIISVGQVIFLLPCGGLRQGLGRRLALRLRAGEDVRTAAGRRRGEVAAVARPWLSPSGAG